MQAHEKKSSYVLNRQNRKFQQSIARAARVLIRADRERCLECSRAHVRDMGTEWLEGVWLVLMCLLTYFITSTYDFYRNNKTVNLKLTVAIHL